MGYQRDSQPVEVSSTEEVDTFPGGDTVDDFSWQPPLSKQSEILRIDFLSLKGFLSRTPVIVSFPLSELNLVSTDPTETSVSFPSTILQETSELYSVV